MPDARHDIGVFAAEVLNRPLWEHQLTAASCGAFITSVAAARRVGKTTLAETMAVHTAMTRRGARAVVLSATETASRRLTEEMLQLLTARRLTREAVQSDSGASRIRLANGSEIFSLPSSPRQVRGLGRGVLLVIIDEASFCDDGLWQAARYLALDHRAEGARILLLGTPRGGAHDFFRRAWEAGQDGDPDHASFQWTYEANPNLDHAYLERERDRVPAVEYASEVLGEWSDAAGSLFPWPLLDAATADIDVLSLDRLPVGPRFMVGVDYGVSFDQSAAVVIARLPVGRFNDGDVPKPVFGIVGLELWRPGAPLTTVARSIAESPALWEVVSTEVSGVGAGPSQELHARLRSRSQTDRRRRHRWNPVATSAALKTTGYGWLLSLLEQGRLTLPRHPKLLRQFAGMRIEERARGFARIEAEDPVVHDDLSDAAMLAAAPFSSGGQQRCYLAGCAKRARQIPDAVAPHAETDLVTRGDGLLIPRKPLLQSVRGSESSSPVPAATWA